MFLLHDLRDYSALFFFILGISILNISLLKMVPINLLSLGKVIINSTDEFVENQIISMLVTAFKSFLAFPKHWEMRQTWLQMRIITD